MRQYQRRQIQNSEDQMKRLAWTAVIALVLLSPAGTANAIRNLPLEQKVAMSDVVVVGWANSKPHSEQLGQIRLEFVTIVVDKVLKGAPPKTIEVMTKGSIAELNTECCTEGTRYLFFLRKSNEGRYASSNGRYGIISLSPDKQ